MPTPRTKTPTARDRLLEVAQESFLRDGYDANLEGVAAAAGVTRQTVYNLFGSKAGFFRAVIQKLVADTVPNILAFEIKDNLRGSLVQLADRYIEVMLSPRALQTHRIMSSPSSPLDEMRRTLWEMSALPLHDRVRDYMTARMHAGELIVADYDLVAEQFLGSLLGQTHQRATYGIDESTPPMLKRRCREAVDAFLRSYGAPAAKPAAALRKPRP